MEINFQIRFLDFEFIFKKEPIQKWKKYFEVKNVIFFS